MPLKFSTVIKNLLLQSCSRALYFKDQVLIDADKYDALEWACIQLGLSTKPFDIKLDDRQDQWEISILTN